LLRCNYVPDNTSATEVFDRLVYGLKDDDGSYIQKGMPDTFFLDKRMNVIPYKSEGYIFKITSRDNDHNTQLYYLKLGSITGTFKITETVTISGTYQTQPISITAIVTKVYSDSIEVKDLSGDLSNNYVGFNVVGSITETTATFNGFSKGSSKFQPHTLIVEPTDLSRKNTKATYVKHFVPEHEVTYLFKVKLGKQWNRVTVKNDTTGEAFSLIFNVRYYATIIDSYADEIYKWIQKPIDTERANIFHYLSTRLVEMYITYKDLMPNTETIQRLGLILSVQNLISFPGSNASVRDFGVALTGNTPYINIQQNETEILPAIFYLYNDQQLFSGNTFSIWLRNRQILRWVTLLKYVDNVPFYKLNEVTENKIDIIKTHPLETYVLQIVQSINNTDGDFETDDIIQIVGTTITAQVLGSYTSTCNNVSYIRFISLSNVEGSNSDLVSIFGIGPSIPFTIQAVNSDSNVKATGVFNQKPELIYDWNYATLDGEKKDPAIDSLEFQLKGIQRSLDYIFTDTIADSVEIATLEAQKVTVQDQIQTLVDEGKNVYLRNIRTHNFDFSNNPLNDDWQFDDCFAVVVQDMVMTVVMPTSFCASFFPWDRYVENLLKYEPTVAEEAALRITQLDIDDIGVSSSSSSSLDSDIWTYSRHTDYPTLLDEGDAVLNRYFLTGFALPIYDSLAIDAQQVGTLPYASVIQTNGSFDNLSYNSAGDAQLPVIHDGVYGFVPYIANQWNTAYTLQYIGPLTYDDVLGNSLIPNTIVYSASDISKDETFDSGYPYGDIVLIKLPNRNYGVFFTGSPTHDKNNWRFIESGDKYREAKRGWYTNFSINPVTYLPDLSQCQGFPCTVLDQIVDWSTMDAPITDEVINYAYPIPSSFTPFVPPDSQFSATPLFGPISLAVIFSDESTGEVETWHWLFGDGTESFIQNPSHTYTTVGIYEVALTTTGPQSTISTITKTLYVYANDAWTSLKSWVGDDFETGSQKAYWHPETQSWNVTTMSGDKAIVNPSSSTGFDWLTPVSADPIQGDFNFQAGIRLTDPLGFSWIYMGIQLSIDNINHPSLIMGWAGTAGPNKFSFSRRDPLGFGNPFVPTVYYDPSASGGDLVHVRMTRVGSTFRALWSTDGTIFTQMGTSTVSASIDVKGIMIQASTLQHGLSYVKLEASSGLPLTTVL